MFFGLVLVLGCSQSVPLSTAEQHPEATPPNYVMVDSSEYTSAPQRPIPIFEPRPYDTDDRIDAIEQGLDRQIDDADNVIRTLQKSAN